MVKRDRPGSDAEVEVEVQIHPDLPPARAIAIAMYESDAWCRHVDEVRRSYSQRLSERARL